MKNREKRIELAYDYWINHPNQTLGLVAEKYGLKYQHLGVYITKEMERRNLSFELVVEKCINQNFVEARGTILTFAQAVWKNAILTMIQSAPCNCPPEKHKDDCIKFRLISTPFPTFKNIFVDGVFYEG